MRATRPQSRRQNVSTWKRWLALKALCGLIALAASSPDCAAVDVSFIQNSSPGGLISGSSTLVPVGSQVTTVAAPLESSVYRFTFWTLNGVRRADELGRSLNPVLFIINEPTTATATYTNLTLDADADKIPDWFELHFFGTTTNTPASDADLDGFTLEDEYIRDYHPRLKDVLVEGGISQRSSPLILVLQDTNFVVLTTSSSPASFVSSTQVVPVNGELALPDLFGIQSNHRFAYWLFNGERVSDELGRSVGGLSVLLASNSTAVAVFIPHAQDSDSDAVPDWFEHHFYGTLANAGDSDTDGDGFTLRDEFQRDYHPGLRDDLVDGGISRRASPLISFLDTDFRILTLISDPLGVVDASLVVALNSSQPLPDVYGEQSGHRFAQWLFNGERVSDELGRSVGGVGQLIESNSTAVAQFLLQNLDSDNDGVADWFEYHFYGTLAHDAEFDGDGDGFTLKDEFVRDYHPGLRDDILDGGTSHRPSALIFVDLRAIVFCKFDSVPTGLVNSNAFIRSGEIVQTPDLAAGVGGYIFGHWKVNGVRQVDGNGYPLTQVSFEVITNSTATAFLYLPETDSDGDGMPDWWEDYHFGGPTNAVAGANADGDELTNLQEYLAGTDPRSALSSLRILEVEQVTEGWKISFPSVAGKLYRVEYAVELTESTSWEVLMDDIEGDGTVIEIVDPTADDEPMRFYRVVLK